MSAAVVSAYGVPANESTRLPRLGRCSSSGEGISAARIGHLEEPAHHREQVERLLGAESLPKALEELLILGFAFTGRTCRSRTVGPSSLRLTAATTVPLLRHDTTL